MFTSTTRRTRALCATPIIDREGHVVGWTDNPPTISASGRMHHPQAEALLHGPIIGAYVQIADHNSAMKAGAPDFWREPWRCLAIVPTEPDKFST